MPRNSRFHSIHFAQIHANADNHALHHPKAMLLIDNHQAQALEFHVVLKQGVRADHHLRVAPGDMTANVAFAVLFKRSGQQHDAVTGWLQNPARRKIVLSCEDLGRRHHRHLITVLHAQCLPK